MNATSTKAAAQDTPATVPASRRYTLGEVDDAMARLSHMDNATADDIDAIAQLQWNMRLDETPTVDSETLDDHTARLLRYFYPAA